MTTNYLMRGMYLVEVPCYDVVPKCYGYRVTEVQTVFSRLYENEIAYTNISHTWFRTLHDALQWATELTEEHKKTPHIYSGIHVMVARRYDGKLYKHYEIDRVDPMSN